MSAAAVQASTERIDSRRDRRIGNKVMMIRCAKDVNRVISKTETGFHD
jgi:hypothetical protein